MTWMWVMWVVPASLLIVVILLWRVAAKKEASESSSGAKDGDKKKGGWSTFLKWAVVAIVIIGIVLVIRGCSHERGIAPETRSRTITGPAIVPGDGPDIYLHKGEVRELILHPDIRTPWVWIPEGCSAVITMTHPDDQKRSRVVQFERRSNGWSRFWGPETQEGYRVVLRVD